MQIKQEAMQVLANLPETATWNDIIILFMSEKVFRVINDGQTFPHDKTNLEVYLWNN